MYSSLPTRLFKIWQPGWYIPETIEAKSAHQAIQLFTRLPPDKIFYCGESPNRVLQYVVDFGWGNEEYHVTQVDDL